MYKVYLSGPIDGLTHGAATNWRNDAKMHLEDGSPIKVLDPMRSKEWLAGQVIHGDMHEKTGHWSTSAEFIGMRDHWDTVRADLMLVNLLYAKKVSIGTVLEIGMAHAARVPIVLVMEKTDNIHRHPMISNYASIRFDDLHSAISMTKAYLSA